MKLAFAYDSKTLIPMRAQVRRTPMLLKFGAQLTFAAATVAGVGLLLASPAARAESAAAYPSRNITIIVPFTPAGTTDILARMIGAKLAEKFNLEQTPQFVIPAQAGIQTTKNDEELLRLHNGK